MQFLTKLVSFLSSITMLFETVTKIKIILNPTFPWYKSDLINLQSQKLDILWTKLMIFFFYYYSNLFKQLSFVPSYAWPLYESMCIRL